MAFAGRGNPNTILQIIDGRQKFSEDINPRDITASGQINVPQGELLPLTVREADGSPINTVVHDIIFPNASVISSGNQVQVVFPTADSGLIFNPSASSTDNALVRWDGTTGAVIQDSNAILDDGGTLTLASGLNVGADADIDGRLLLPQQTVPTGWTAVLDTTHFVLATSGAGPVVLPPSPVVGQTHMIKDIAGLASSINVTVLGSGANIDGAASALLVNDYEAFGVVWNGTEWSRF